MSRAWFVTATTIAWGWTTSRWTISRRRWRRSRAHLPRTSASSLGAASAVVLPITTDSRRASLSADASTLTGSRSGLDSGVQVDLLALLIFEGNHEGIALLFLEPRRGGVLHHDVIGVAVVDVEMVGPQRAHLQRAVVAC